MINGRFQVSDGELLHELYNKVRPINIRSELYELNTVLNREQMVLLFAMGSKIKELARNEDDDLK